MTGARNRSTSEEELLAAIRRVAGADAPRVVVGIGDDAAVLETGAGQLVVTTDMLIEGVHFRRDWLSARDLGFKAAAVNLSDLAAMAASPRHCLVSLGLPRDISLGWIMELYSGMADAIAEHGVSLVGGDLDRAEEVVVSVTMTGEVAPGRAVLRSGARPGDAIAVTGNLGAAAGGLEVARGGPKGVVCTDWGRELARAFARPIARVGEAQVLAGAGVTAMMDISDGLSTDLARMCEASGVGAAVALDSVPVSGALLEGAGRLGADALKLALSGGEDYELLVAIPPERVDTAAAQLADRFGVILTVVGGFTAGSGVAAVDTDGTTRPLPREGWDHFA